MPGYSQANRPLSVTTPLGQDVLLLVGFRGEEAISRLFRFQLDLLADRKATVAFDRIIGRNVTVTLRLPGGGQRCFNGIVSRFSQGKRDASFTHYRAEVVPQFWLWTRRAQCRIFQQLSVPEILKRVLDKLNVTFEITGQYAPRDYCVQYRETDFALASRLMEEEGIYYFFRHTERDHPMVVTDGATRHPSLPGQAAVPYVEDEGGVRPPLRVTDWVKTQEVRSGRYTLWDHCFELPGRNLEATALLQEKAAAGQAAHRLRVDGNDALEIYDYPGGYAQRFDGVDKGGADRPADLKKIFEDNKRTVQVRMEEEAAGALEAEGGSTCPHFLPGYQFTLTGHFDANGPYLLTRVEHTARLEGAYRAGGAETFGYENRFTCIPIGVAYRPRRVTPKPVLAGTQTATVVTASGQEVFLDKYGRVKVQFPWDREGKKDANSSCWVRVAQVWAGKRWGAFFWPRAGQEVVVAFEEGDPDRPIIVGSVYNAENMPPFHPTREPLVNGIKSCSERGHPDKNYNALLFYDKPGNEHTQVHSENHQLFTNETSKHSYIGEAHAQVVGGLPGLGSGSGGQGPGDQPKKPDDPPPGSYDQKDNAPDGIFGTDLKLSYGQSLEGVLGLSFEQVTGGKSEYYFDPFGSFAGDIGSLSANAGTGILAALMTLFGKSEFKFCTEASFLYGPKYDIQRGPAYVWQASLTKSPLALLGAELACSLPLISVLTYGLITKKMPVKDRSKVCFVMNAACSIAEMLLAALERTNAVEDICKTVLDEHEALIEQLEPLVSPLRYLGEYCVKPVLDKIQRQTSIATVIAVDGPTQPKSSDEWKAWGFPDVQSCDGVYARQGHDIELVAKWDSAPAGYGICIDAQGGGTKQQDGNLILNATGTVMMTAGASGLSINSKNKVITMECDEGGKIYIRHPAVMTQPVICVQDEEIHLQVGPLPATMSHIVIKKDEITLACGPLTMLQLTPTGISLKVGETSIKLDAKGIEKMGMMIKSNSQIQQESDSGVPTKVTAGATLQFSAALTQMG